jgi:hypothetical protein
MLSNKDMSATPEEALKHQQNMINFLEQQRYNSNQPRREIQIRMQQETRHENQAFRRYYIKTLCM